MCAAIKLTCMHACPPKPPSLGNELIIVPVVCETAHHTLPAYTPHTPHINPAFTQTSGAGTPIKVVTKSATTDVGGYFVTPMQFSQGDVVLEVTHYWYKAWPVTTTYVIRHSPHPIAHTSYTIRDTPHTNAATTWHQFGHQ